MQGFESSIFRMEMKNDKIYDYKTCPKCEGIGITPKAYFCMKCWGSGKIPMEERVLVN